MIYYKNSSELYHHGILGQKWGVRRYQNADGTLTDAGKKKRLADSAKFERRNPSKAEVARSLRDSRLDMYKKSINRRTEENKQFEKAKNIDVSKVDFDARADAEIAEMKNIFNEDKYSSRTLSDQEAIDFFFIFNYGESRPTATKADVANALKEDEEFMITHKIYDSWIDDNNKEIADGKARIDKISNMTLKEIYEHKNDL